MNAGPDSRRPSHAEFCRNYSGTRLQRIACGANRRDERWTRVMMDKVGRRMQGLSLHYYTTHWDNKGSATEFDERLWFDTLRRATRWTTSSPATAP